MITLTLLSGKELRVSAYEISSMWQAEQGTAIRVDGMTHIIRETMDEVLAKSDYGVPPEDDEENWTDESAPLSLIEKNNA